MTTTDPTPAHPLIEIMTTRLPAQVTTLTHESGVSVDIRIMDADRTPYASHLAVDALRWLAAEAERNEEFGIVGWLNAVEDEVLLRHPDAAS